MKTLGYYLFAIMYYIGCIFPVNNNKFFCVMTHDGSDDSSVGVVVQEIKRRNDKARFVYVRKSDKRVSGMLSLFLIKPFEMASSGMILMDNEFLPLSNIRPRKGVKVVQLWHGTGTIKKFGHDISEGKMLRLVERADKRITHLIVNSEYTGSLYQHIFGVTKDKVYVTGIPRTDVMFDNAKKKEKLRAFYEGYPELRDKKLVLYAPTFRDDEISCPKVMLDIDKWAESIREEYILLLRLHPFVAAAFSDSRLDSYNGKIINVSAYEDLNTLLFAADMLITDYSSIVFEYALLDRPMIFYAYDLGKFESDSRGFYEDYEDYVPGAVVKTTKGIIEIIENEQDEYSQKRLDFVRKYYKYTDGKSTDRFLRTVLNTAKD